MPLAKFSRRHGGVFFKRLVERCSIVKAAGIDNIGNVQIVILNQEIFGLFNSIGINEIEEIGVEMFVDNLRCMVSG